MSDLVRSCVLNSDPSDSVRSGVKTLRCILGQHVLVMLVYPVSALIQSCISTHICSVSAFLTFKKIRATPTGVPLLR